jgi:hypothetical protein
MEIDITGYRFSKKFKDFVNICTSKTRELCNNELESLPLKIVYLGKCKKDLTLYIPDTNFLPHNFPTFVLSFTSTVNLKMFLREKKCPIKIFKNPIMKQRSLTLVLPDNLCEAKNASAISFLMLWLIMGDRIKFKTK